MNYIFESSPKGNYYFMLLDLLVAISDKFILVKRADLEYDEDCGKFMQEICKYLLSTTHSNEWPGTRLQDDNKACVYYYKANKDSISILKKYSNSLFAWISPKLPEDLSFLRNDGSVILGNIAHEGDYWLNLTEAELKLAKEKFPKLILLQEK